MNNRTSCLVTIDGVASRLRLAVSEEGSPPPRVRAGVVCRIRKSCAVFVAADGRTRIEARDSVVAGHSGVHGGPGDSQPRVIKRECLVALLRISPLSSEYMPAERALMQAFRESRSDRRQLASVITQNRPMMIT